jgi:hypothetical protein
MTQYDDIIVTPVYQPQSHQYPCVLPFSGGLGTMTGKPTPIQFYPQQQSPDMEENTNARHMYRRTYGAPVPSQVVVAKKKFIGPCGGPAPSSLRTEKLKSIAVGKYSYKMGLPTSAPLSTKSYFPTEVRTTLKRVRNRGCAAPAKKGSIYNTHLNSLSPGWGNTGVRTTY